MAGPKTPQDYIDQALTEIHGGATKPASTFTYTPPPGALHLSQIANTYEFAPGARVNLQNGVQYQQEKAGPDFWSIKSTFTPAAQLLGFRAQAQAGPSAPATTPTPGQTPPNLTSPLLGGAPANPLSSLVMSGSGTGAPPSAYATLNQQPSRTTELAAQQFAARGAGSGSLTLPTSLTSRNNPGGPYKDTEFAIPSGAGLSAQSAQGFSPTAISSLNNPNILLEGPQTARLGQQDISRGGVPTSTGFGFNPTQVLREQGFQSSGNPATDAFAAYQILSRNGSVPTGFQASNTMAPPLPPGDQINSGNYDAANKGVGSGGSAPTAPGSGDVIGPLRDAFSAMLGPVAVQAITDYVNQAAGAAGAPASVNTAASPVDPFDPNLSPSGAPPIGMAGGGQMTTSSPTAIITLPTPQAPQPQVLAVTSEYGQPEQVQVTPMSGLTQEGMAAQQTANQMNPRYMPLNGYESSKQDMVNYFNPLEVLQVAAAKAAAAKAAAPKAAAGPAPLSPRAFGGPFMAAGGVTINTGDPRGVATPLQRLGSYDSNPPAQAAPVPFDLGGYQTAPQGGAPTDPFAPPAQAAPVSFAPPSQPAAPTTPAAIGGSGLTSQDLGNAAQTQRSRDVFNYRWSRAGLPAPTAFTGTGPASTQPGVYQASPTLGANSEIQNLLTKKASYGNPGELSSLTAQEAAIKQLLAGYATGSFLGTNGVGPMYATPQQAQAALTQIQTQIAAAQALQGINQQLVNLGYV